MVPIRPCSSDDSPGWFPEHKNPHAARNACTSSADKIFSCSKNSIWFLNPPPLFLPTFPSFKVTVSSMMAVPAGRGELTKAEVLIRMPPS